MFTVDADGQHDLAVLDELVEITIDERPRREPRAPRPLVPRPYQDARQLGAERDGRALWAGHRLHDVESGYRIFRLGALAHALDFYSGYQYSETVEVAVVMCDSATASATTTSCPVPVSGRARACATR